MRDPFSKVGPSLQRDLGVILGGLLVAAGCVGAGVGVAVDVLIRRHRAT